MDAALTERGQIRYPGVGVEISVVRQYRIGRVEDHRFVEHGMEPNTVVADAAVFKGEKTEHSAGNLPSGGGAAEAGSDMDASEGPLRHHLVISGYDLIDVYLEGTDMTTETLNMGSQAIPAGRPAEDLVGFVNQVRLGQFRDQLQATVGDDLQATVGDDLRQIGFHQLPGCLLRVRQFHEEPKLK